MKAGRKPVSNAIKQARGTTRKDRARSEITIEVDRETPTAPAYLSAAALAVWNEEIGRAIIGQASDLDSSLFARYCSLEAVVREAFAKGEMPKAAYLVELRRSAELFGLGGAASRVGAKGSAPQVSGQPIGFAGFAPRPN